MRKGIAAVAALVVAALMALSFFLPEGLSNLHDQQLLNSPHIQVQNEDWEGFAESIQLTVAEKVMLLRSGTLNVMALTAGEVEGMYVPGPDGWELTLNVSGNEPVLPELKAATDEEITSYFAELNQTWEERLEAAQAEIRSLQAVGGLPELWRESEPLNCTGYGEMLYIDPDTRMSFQVYNLTLSRNTLSMHLMADAQSGRILSFSLQWGQEDAPRLGAQGLCQFRRCLAQLLGYGFGEQRLVRRPHPQHSGARRGTLPEQRRLHRPWTDLLHLRRPVPVHSPGVRGLPGQVLCYPLEYLKNIYKKDTQMMLTGGVARVG